MKNISPAMVCSVSKYLSGDRTLSHGPQKQYGTGRRDSHPDPPYLTSHFNKNQLSKKNTLMSDFSAVCLMLSVAFKKYKSLQVYNMKRL